MTHSLTVTLTVLALSAWVQPSRALLVDVDRSDLN
jgi:hypothetical protein